jgi:hypothetical protein
MTRQFDKHGYDKLTGDDKALAQLRDQIANQDSVVASYQKESTRAHTAIGAAVKYLDTSKKSAGKLFSIAERTSSQARALDQNQRAGYLGLDDLRMTFIRQASDPKAALSTGQQLLSQITKQSVLAATVQEKWFESARAQVLITKDAGLAGHADFWQDVRETMETSDFMQDDSFAADVGASSASDDDDDKKKPVNHYSMKLPEHKGHR